MPTESGLPLAFEPRTKMLTAGSQATFVDGFRGRVRLDHASPALTWETTSLTYGQLEEAANRLARHLAGLGVGPDALVSVSLERGLDLVIALLAVLKTGAAYVPLDPGLPTERLAFMLAQARTPVMVTRESLLPRVPFAEHTVCIDRDRGTIARQAATPLPVHIEPGGRAYVIFTSGSTGQPKGVEITHRAMMNVLESFREVPGLGPRDRVLALTTVSFDIAVIELWLPLLVGARIVLASREAATDGRAIAELIARHQVTFAQATPATWRLVVESGWSAAAGLTALCGGEALSRDLADALLASGADLWNVYGPTETTVWSSIWHVARDGPIRIGRPIRETEMLVLASDGRPAAQGEIGELCIGGAGLARGYLNQPELTADKFIAHPASDTAGVRVYRTGDLARQHADGTFEWLGRIDHQVKIDGFRIELGEIEATLARHPAVHQVVVSAVERRPGDTSLVAYIEHGSALPPSREDLQRLARGWLPAYMMPSAFVMLRQFPLNASGKVDRNALPAPDWPQAPVAEEVACTPLERRLLELWREVLGLESVGSTDDFFDLGGRSRHAAILLARIQSEFGRRLPLTALFDAPSVAEFSAMLDRPSAAPRERPCLVPIRPSGTLAPFCCVHAMGGDVVIYGDLAKHLGPDLPFFGLQAVGLDESGPPLQSIGEMAERYVAEVRTRQPQGPYFLAGYSFGGVIAFEMAVQLRTAGEGIGFLGLIDTDFPGDMASPLWTALARYGVFRRRIYPTLQRAKMHAASLRRLGPRHYARYVSQRAVESMRAEGLVDGHRAGDGSDADRFTAVLQRIRDANARAMIQYVPRWFDGTLTYFLARDASFERDRRKLWRSVAREVDIRVVPGTHSTVRLEPDVRILAGELLDSLTRAQKASRAA